MKYMLTYLHSAFIAVNVTTFLHLKCRKLNVLLNTKNRKNYADRIVTHMCTWVHLYITVRVQNSYSLMVDMIATRLYYIRVSAILGQQENDTQDVRANTYMYIYVCVCVYSYTSRVYIRVYPRALLSFFVREKTPITTPRPFCRSGYTTTAGTYIEPRLTRGFPFSYTNLHRPFPLFVENYAFFRENPQDPSHRRETTYSRNIVPV